MYGLPIHIKLFNISNHIFIDTRVQNNQIHNDLYTKTRERALLQLIFDKTMKNASFILDNDLIDIIVSHPKKNLTLVYNVMAACGLNSLDSWKYLLSCTQSMVTCGVCHGPVMWYKSDLDQPTKIDRFGHFTCRTAHLPIS